MGGGGGVGWRTTWISASILIELYTLSSVFKIESCFHFFVFNQIQLKMELE